MVKYGEWMDKFEEDQDVTDALFEHGYNAEAYLYFDYDDIVIMRRIRHVNKSVLIEYCGHKNNTTSIIKITSPEKINMESLKSIRWNYVPSCHLIFKNIDQDEWCVNWFITNGFTVEFQ